MPADGRARAGVLLCPSLGKEQAETTRAMKLLAQGMAARGFAVLRFDYLCSGESWGAQYRHDAGDLWMASLTLALKHLRSVVEGPMIGVGHRAGALLLGSDRSLVRGLDALVLWDPVVRGRSFIRAKTVLYNMVSEGGGDAPPAPSEPATTVLPGRDPRVAYVHTAGQSLHPDTAGWFGKLSLSGDVAAELAGARTVLAVRPGDRDGRLAIAAAQHGATILELGEQERFLGPDAPSELTFPTADFAALTNWIDDTVGGAEVPVTPGLRDTAVVGRTATGTAIVTRVTDQDVGCVWDTAPEDAHHTATAVLVAHSLGQYIRTGPSRLYYEAALAAAQAGGRGIRYDRPTVGESGTAHPSDAELPLYTRRYIDDGVAVLNGLQIPEGATVAHSGICVGSWMAAHAALRGPDRVGRANAVLVNPLIWRLTPVRRYRAGDLAGASDLDGTPRTVANVPLPARIRRAVRWRVGRSTPRLRRMVPRRLRTAAVRLPFVQLPEAVFDAFASAGAGVELVFAPADLSEFEQVGGLTAVSIATEPVAVTVADAGDHTSYHVAMREAVVDQCLRATGVRIDSKTSV